MESREKLDDALSSMGVNTARGVRMPIVFPGDVAPVRIKNAEGEPTEDVAYLELLSEDSPAGQELTRTRSKEAVARAKKNRGDPSEDPIDWQVNLVVALIVGWRLARPDGTEIDLPFSKQAARRLLSNPDMGWLRRDAVMFVGDAANFTRALSKS